MKKVRKLFWVSVDLDPMPGTMHTEESAQKVISKILRDRLVAYNPIVTPAPDELQPSTKDFERVVSTITSAIVDNTDLQRWTHKIALQRAGLTARELEQLGETEGTDPRYKLYYAELTNLTILAANAALSKMSKPA